MCDIDDILSRIDHLEIYSRYLDLEKRGSEYVAISPFSGTDTNASFTITESNWLWYDFSFGSGGGVLDFLRRIEKCSFQDALKILCESIGEDVENVSKRLEVLKELRRFQQAQKTTKPSQKAKPIDQNIMSKYDWNEDKLRTWYNEGISWEIMRKYNVRYDVVSDAICFPIVSNDGVLVNVKKRNLSPEATAKYIYCVGWCGAGDDILFNLYRRRAEIKKKNEILVFESEKAVLMCESAGITNSVALATSHLSAARGRVLAELGVNVVFCLDREIQPWLDKSIQSLKRFVRVEYLFDKENLLKDKQAPCDAGWQTFWKLYNDRKALR